VYAPSGSRRSTVADPWAGSSFYTLLSANRDVHPRYFTTDFNAFARTCRRTGPISQRVAGNPQSDRRPVTVDSIESQQIRKVRHVRLSAQLVRYPTTHPAEKPPNCLAVEKPRSPYRVHTLGEIISFQIYITFTLVAIQLYEH